VAMSGDIGDRKRALRATMRLQRSTVDRRAERTTQLWSYVRAEPAVRSARVVMAFEATSGEPDSHLFLTWCRTVGKSVVVPAYDPSAPPPVAAHVPDVVIVPGLAFTRDGARLGQGSGWYDRFLPDVRPDCTTIGVGFAPQLHFELPQTRYDVRVDLVITDQGRHTSNLASATAAAKSTITNAEPT
jgi:5-formyltetrahydrofolate cyclo-ligase